MKEVFEVIVESEDGYQRGGLHEFGQLNLGDKTYPPDGKNIASIIENKKGHLVCIEDILMREEDFSEETIEIETWGMPQSLKV